MQTPTHPGPKTPSFYVHEDELFLPAELSGQVVNEQCETVLIAKMQIKPASLLFNLQFSQTPPLRHWQLVICYILGHGHAIIHAHPFNGPFSGTTRVGRYQKGKTNLDFTEAKDNEWQWQWHQLGHMKVCTSLQTDNHASTSPLSFYRPDALPVAQPTASKLWSTP